MAKRNSTKTATKEALQAAEPRLQAFRQWKGINFSEVSPIWNPYVNEVFTGDNQTDLVPNYLLVQNNMKTTAQALLESSYSPVPLLKGPAFGANYTWADTSGEEPVQRTIAVDKLTGVSLIDHEFGYFGATTNTTDCVLFKISRVPFEEGTAGTPSFMDFDTSNNKVIEHTQITDLHVYLNRLICMVEKSVVVPDSSPERRVPVGGIYLSDEDDEHQFVSPLYSGYKLLPQTTAADAPTITTHGNVHSVDTTQEDPLYSSRCTFFYCLTNQFGATQSSIWGTGAAGYTTEYFDIGPSQWTEDDYITISGHITADNLQRAEIGDTGKYRQIGVDIYMLQNESTYPIFVGHTTMQFDQEENPVWSYDFHGAMTDLTEWSMASLEVPTDNTTGGVEARYVNEIDGRIYFWGDPKYPYRLYIGGNSGNEFSIATGVGGAFIDVEPGAGTEIKMVEKFKTYGGSSIVTILCSNVNGTRQHRYNLIETNITTTSELSIAGYMVEQISNVVGTSSRHGGGVWADGMYYITRNGLMVTTQQMEYSSQLKSISVSDPISPVFEEQKGTEIANSYVVCAKDIIYIAMCPDTTDSYQDIDANVSNYNKFIWCYDVGLKAWYTLQPMIPFGATSQMLTPNGLFVYDHEDSVFYGLGVVDSNYGAFVIPMLDNQESHAFTYGEFPAPTLANPYKFNAQRIHFETGELGTGNPNTQWQWLCQLEFNFDWFVGNVDIIVEGVDYYGRRMHIVKHVESPVTNGKPILLTALNVFMRIDTMVRYYHITIDGTAMCKLSNIIARTYTESKRIGIPYGYNTEHYYVDRFNGTQYVHKAVSVYNNLAKLPSSYEIDSSTGMPVLDKETATVT